MKIKQRLKAENREFIEGWKAKREAGIIKFALFSTAIIVIDNFINHERGINTTDILIITIISVSAPVIGWFVNEYRYKKT